MTSKELVKQALAKWHFPILEENDTCIVIRFQLSLVQIGSLREDNDSIEVQLCGFFKADDAGEYNSALKACNKLNSQIMRLKFYIDGDNDLNIASEFQYIHEEDVEPMLYSALRIVVGARSMFEQQYEATRQEEQLINDLNDA